MFSVTWKLILMESPWWERDVALALVNMLMIDDVQVSLEQLSQVQNYLSMFFSFVLTQSSSVEKKAAEIYCHHKNVIIIIKWCYLLFKCSKRRCCLNITWLDFNEPTVTSRIRVKPNALCWTHFFVHAIISMRIAILKRVS